MAWVEDGAQELVCGETHERSRETPREETRLVILPIGNVKAAGVGDRAALANGIAW